MVVVAKEPQIQHLVAHFPQGVIEQPLTSADPEDLVLYCQGAGEVAKSWKWILLGDRGWVAPMKRELSDLKKEDRSWFLIDVEEGFAQGCPASPVFAAIVLQHILKKGGTGYVSFGWWAQFVWRLTRWFDGRYPNFGGICGQCQLPPTSTRCQTLSRQLQAPWQASWSYHEYRKDPNPHVHGPQQC